MSVKALAKNIAARAVSLRENRRILNMACAKLNGVAATVPEGVTYPLSAFIGYKVILHNVGVDVDTGEIQAVIVIPYKGGGNFPYAGHKLKYAINENWFN